MVRQLDEIADRPLLELRLFIERGIAARDRRRNYL